MRWRDLGEVVEGIALTLSTLNILLLEQGLDGLLDVLNLRSEPLRDLRDDLLDQCLVFERLPRLHDTDNGRLDDIFTVFVDRLEHVNGLRFDLRLDRLVKVDTNLDMHDQV